MNVTHECADQNSGRLVFGARMTVAHASELEDQIIQAVQRYERLEVDLSGVKEIDICGVHLLGMLQTLGGSETRIVATSPVVDQQYRRLLASHRGVALRGAPSERRV